jgi:hypothetical protein
MNAMTQTILPQPHEQKRVEKLLVKLSTVKAISPKPPQSVRQEPTIFLSATAHSRVFYST